MVLNVHAIMKRFWDIKVADGGLLEQFHIVMLLKNVLFFFKTFDGRGSIVNLLISSNPKFSL